MRLYYASFGTTTASERIGVLAAYRYIDMDYEDDDGNLDFIYDMSMSGPAAAVMCNRCTGRARNGNYKAVS